VSVIQTQIAKLYGTLPPYKLKSVQEILEVFTKDNIERKNHIIAAIDHNPEEVVALIENGKIVCGQDLNDQAAWDSKLEKLTSVKDDRFILVLKELLTQSAFGPIIISVCRKFAADGEPISFVRQSYKLIKNGNDFFVQIKCTVSLLSNDEEPVKTEAQIAVIYQIVQEVGGWGVRQVQTSGSLEPEFLKLASLDDLRPVSPANAEKLWGSLSDSLLSSPPLTSPRQVWGFLSAPFIPASPAASSPIIPPGMSPSAVSP
jgi:hypothetical protein